MLDLLVYLLVVFIVVGVAWWLTDYIPLPEPLNRLAKVVIIVIGAFVIVYVLLALSGGAPRVGLPRP
jgi:hypothetical protein